MKTIESIFTVKGDRVRLIYKGIHVSLELWDGNKESNRLRMISECIAADAWMAKIKGEA